MNYQLVGDPETHTRIEQYELAFRMQSSVPELTAINNEPESTYTLYGEEAKKPGLRSFRTPGTANDRARCAVRPDLSQQLGHSLQRWRPFTQPVPRCRPTLHRLDPRFKARGLLDETLVIWGGEFGRTIYSQGGLKHDNYGRDHHPRCFTMWMAGGGTRPGTIYGETDEFSYNIVKDPVHIRDFHATVLQLLGFDHKRFTYRYQGLDQRLTGVEPAKVIPQLLA